MVDEIAKQIAALREGFFEIIQKDYFVYFDWRDLEKVIMGIPEIDCKSIKINLSQRFATEHRICKLWSRLVSHHLVLGDIEDNDRYRKSRLFNVLYWKSLSSIWWIQKPKRAEWT